MPSQQRNIILRACVAASAVAALFILAAVHGTYQGLYAAHLQEQLSPAAQEAAGYEQRPLVSRDSMGDLAMLTNQHIQSGAAGLDQIRQALLTRSPNDASALQQQTTTKKNSNLPFPNGVPLSGPGNFSKVRLNIRY